MNSLDDSFVIFDEIFRAANENILNIQTEEDSKIQLINRMFNECLGWSLSDFVAERKHDNGFSDYILQDKGNPLLLIEAKRKDLLVISTAERNQVRYLKMSGPGLKDAIGGIDQAAGYAAPNGLPIAVLTDGFVWIVFKSFVPGENFKNKEAIVFPSLEAVKNDFSIFFELLAKDQFKRKVYSSIFDKIHNNRLLLSSELISPIDERDIKISQKSEIAFDLDQVFSNFFAKLTGDGDEDLLIECFVESRESRIADFSLEKMTTSVLGNIVPHDRSVDDALKSLIESNVEIEPSPSESGQTIFIVGPTGAGKSTFLDRFFKRTLPHAIRQRCVLIKVNFLDASGSEGTVLSWLTETIISELEREVYPNGSPEWDDLLGLYHIEYLRRSKGVDKHLYERDKQAFKEKFGVYLDQQVENDREGYLNRLLKDVVVNRKMLPILLIDNTDEFSAEYKQRVFQFTQAIRRNINHCLVIFPVTDKSAWSFSKTDIYGIYTSKSFFLPTPSPREVFRKRIEFLKNKIKKVEQGTGEKKSYFLNKGIKISIENIESFAHILENIFVDHDYTSKTIGELTNYNIRRTLLLSQRVITSSVLKIEDLIKSYLSGDSVTTKFDRFMDALIKGDYELYKKGDNHEIYPVFQVEREIKQSPLLKLRILTLLDSMRKGSRTIDEKHLKVQSIIDYFDSIGATEMSVERALIALVEAGLIELYDSSTNELSYDQRLAISYRGMAHLRLASRNSVYFFQMALTTAITNEEVAHKISSIYKSNASFINKLENIKKEFSEYLIAEDGKYISLPRALDQYACQSEIISDLTHFSIKRNEPANELFSTLGAPYMEGTIKTGVIAIVDRYDSYKGYGFAEVDELDVKVFFDAATLSVHGLKTLKDGDEILCDIARNSNGVYIEKIHDVATDQSKIEVLVCRIIRVFHDRQYGFVKIQDGNREAIFYTSIFPEEQRSGLSEGMLLKAEISPDPSGQAFQVMKVIYVL